MIQIVDARPVHVGIIAGQDRDIPRKLIRAYFRQSSYRRTALLDGYPVAIWGITGTLCEMTGVLWLRLTTPARKLPRLVVRECWGELERMLAVRHEVICYIDDEDKRAQRFAQFFGFHLGAPERHECGIFRYGILKR